MGAGSIRKRKRLKTATSAGQQDSSVGSSAPALLSLQSLPRQSGNGDYVAMTVVSTTRVPQLIAPVSVVTLRSATVTSANAEGAAVEREDETPDTESPPRSTRRRRTTARMSTGARRYPSEGRAVAELVRPDEEKDKTEEEKEGGAR